jgi:ABC-type nickel/cobalt efflux system permease component RcnA
VVGLTQLIKDAAGFSGNATRFTAVIVGVVVMLLFQLQSVIADPYSQWFAIAFYALAFGLGAGGFIDTVRSNRPPAINITATPVDDEQSDLDVEVG